MFSVYYKEVKKVKTDAADTVGDSLILVLTPTNVVLHLWFAWSFISFL